MKTFCVLTQTQYRSNKLLESYKNEFNTDFSSFYKLNWKHLDDTDALVCKQNICWSEGRSLLYSHVPKNYEYYIFIDDDIIFKNTTDKLSVSEKIRDMLDYYKPLAGCFNGKHKNGTPEWHLSKIPRKTGAFPIMGYDLNTNIFHHSFAAVMFPIIYHGSGRCMWYSAYICHKLYPGKNICITDISTKNARHEDNESFGLEHFIKPDVITQKFAANLKNPDDFNCWNHKYIMNKNRSVSSQPVSREEVLFGIVDMSKIYDVTCTGFTNRKDSYN